MEFIMEYGYIIFSILALGVVVTIMCIDFFKMPSKKQLSKVREWLLIAVVEAEQVLGSGTGKLKLRYVYDMFVGKFTWMARVLPFETFSNLVDDALDEMRELIDTNEKVAEIVKETN